MKKFAVVLEDRGFRFDVDIEAETIEEAVKIAREKHCEPRMVEVTPTPTWVEPYPEEEGAEVYELGHQVHGDCADCDLTLFTNTGTPKTDEWPWSYTSADDGMYTDVCYPCAMKRKEAGNYCAYFKHFYRDDPVCGECPAGKCPKAQDSYYDALKAVLKRALYHSKAPEKEVQDFFDHNEFGLAFDALQECGPTHESDSRFANNMTKAAEMMKEGWE